MFTGLVSELGVVKSCKQSGNSFKLEIGASRILKDLRIGDSIAVNGACLTVVEFNKDSFKVDVMPQTSKNTVVPNFKMGDKVNLERTVRLGDRLDGHIVQGHVDFVGKIISYKKDDIAMIISISVDKKALKYIVLKGSIAIDGISLTVSQVAEDWFSVSIIPHTAKNTTLGWKKEGDWVNIETDILGKYVEKLLFYNNNSESTADSKLTKNILLENGFM